MALAILSVILTIGFVPALAKLSAPLGLEARPSERRLHDGVVPLVGGPALTVSAIAVLLGSLGALHWSNSFPAWFLYAVAALLTSGAIDDSKELSARAKAICQSATAFALALTGVFRVTNLGGLFGGTVDLGFFAVPFTVLVLVGYINALNMIDGVDGLAGGVSLVQLMFLAFIAWHVHATGVLDVLLAFGGGIVGFLAFNFPLPGRAQARVYLGDSGTQVIALVIGCCAMRLIDGPQAGGVHPIAIAWILALPVMDTLAVMLLRIARGRSPLSADRQHLHHILIDLGMRPASATYLLIAISAVYGAFGLIGSALGIQDWALFAVFILVLLWHTGFVFGSRTALARLDILSAVTEFNAVGHRATASSEIESEPAPLVLSRTLMSQGTD